MLTKTSWDSGRLTSAGRVAARDQLPRRDTRRGHCTPRKLSGWDRGGGKLQPSTGCDHARQGTDHLSCSDLGRAQNAGPTKSVPLWRTQEPEPEWLRPEKWLTSDSSRQSNLESEQCRLGKHTCCEWGQTQCSWHMPVIFVCSVPPSAQHD